MYGWYRVGLSLGCVPYLQRAFPSVSAGDRGTLARPKLVLYYPPALRDLKCACSAYSPTVPTIWCLLWSLSMQAQPILHSRIHGKPSNRVRPPLHSFPLSCVRSHRLQPLKQLQMLTLSWDTPMQPDFTPGLCTALETLSTNVILWVSLFLGNIAWCCLLLDGWKKCLTDFVLFHICLWEED